MSWINTTVGEFCPFSYGKRLPKEKRQAGKYPVYGSNGCVDFHNDFYINGPGIIIGRKGSIGEVNLSTKPFWPIDTSFYVTQSTLGELKFTCYLLKSLGLGKMNSDSAVPGLNRNNVHALPIQIPESSKSRELIGNQLALLDNKIAANRHVNQTLEQIAQALFKSWFIDFDPVKAKMRGEQPHGIDAETAALFPDNFVESELGSIPEGWEITPFSKWATIKKGKNITKRTIIDGDVPVVAGGLKPAYYHNTHNANGPVITISASGANAGFVNLYHENIWASDCSYIAKSTTPMFFLQYVALRYSQKQIFDMQTGGVQPHIYPKDFERLMLVLPDKQVSEKLEKVFVTFFNQMANNTRQSKELTKLRDTLLPKLLSGEIQLNTIAGLGYEL